LLLIAGGDSEHPVMQGIYNEAAEIAFKNKEEINRNFLIDLEFMLRNNIYAAIATHDKKLINGSYRLIKEYKIQADKFEFQMLFGVTPDLRQSVLDKGYTMRVYVLMVKNGLIIVQGA